MTKPCLSLSLLTHSKTAKMSPPFIPRISCKCSWHIFLVVQNILCTCGKIFALKMIKELGAVVHISNSSYSGGQGRRIEVQGKKLETWVGILESRLCCTLHVCSWPRHVNFESWFPPLQNGEHESFSSSTAMIRMICKQREHKVPQKILLIFYSFPYSVFI